MYLDRLNLNLCVVNTNVWLDRTNMILFVVQANIWLDKLDHNLCILNTYMWKYLVCADQAPHPMYIVCHAMQCKCNNMKCHSSLRKGHLGSRGMLLWLVQRKQLCRNKCASMRDAFHG